MKGMIVTGTSWQFRVGTLVGEDSEWVGGGNPGPPDPRLSSGAFGVAFVDGHVKAVRNEGAYAADVEVRRMMCGTPLDEERATDAIKKVTITNPCG